MRSILKRIRDLPRDFWLVWLIGGGLVVAAGTYFLAKQVTESTIEETIFLLILIFGLLFTLWISITSVRNISKIHELEERIDTAEKEIIQTHQQNEAIYQVSQKFVDADDEKEVIELVLKLSIELTGAKGASYVPLDDRGQPLTASSKGDLPFPVANDWAEYLASPAVRDRCGSCQSHSEFSISCPLLKGPFSEGIGMFCLPLSRGDREFGVLNLYLPNLEKLDEQKQDFLRAMIDETSLALESLRLRQRELIVINQIQAIRQKTDLDEIIETLVENSRQTMETDFAYLEIINHDKKIPGIKLFAGDIPEKAKPIVLGIIQGVIESGSPLILGDVTVEPGATQEIKAIMAAPCLSNQQRPIGGLLVGNIRQRNFGTRQMALLQMVANQVSLIVQNSELMADLEFNTMMGERYRLAREIHDGLAQTIGFLKLQVAQMKNYLERSDFVKLRHSLDVTYTTLSDTYLDARQAIDGLRINPAVVNMFCWLQQISQEFGEISGLSVELVNCDNQKVFAPEIQAQFIRIVQEALNNVRKHAQARKVTIRCLVIEDDFWLEIQDDGIGFSPDDISEPSQHGLIGMKERAELLGADFQIISQPNQGTTIRLQLSLQGINTVSANE